MATRTAAPGLSTDELGRIRDTLATGRKPKVVFTATAGQIAGQVGQVVELTDPDLSDEWVVVRFGHDELPFSPVDLELPSRTRQPARAARPAASAAPPPSGASPSSQPSAPQFRAASLPGPREEPSVPSATSTSVNGAGRAAKKPPAAPPGGVAAPAADTPPARAVNGSGKSEVLPAPATASAAGPAGSTVAGQGDDKPKPARKPAKPKAPASLTVTLTYAEGEWMVGAMQGSRALAKPYVIKPSEAMKMVGMIDVPGVHEAVEEIVSAARTEAELQAEKLRAELAEIESKLAELREAG